MPDIRVKAKLTGGVINTKAELGRIVEVPVGPDIYTGEYNIPLTDEDTVLATKGKLLEEDVTIEGAHGKRYTAEGLVGGTEPSGVLYLPNLTKAVTDAIRNGKYITAIIAPNLEELQSNSIGGIGSCTEVYLPKLKIGGSALGGCIALESVHLPSIESMNGTFANAFRMNDVLIGKNIKSITGNICRNLMMYRQAEKWTIRIMGKPETFTGNFNCNVAGDLYVVWSEGEVDGAPWGLTKATIHYNTVFDDEGNVISSD